MTMKGRLYLTLAIGAASLLVLKAAELVLHDPNSQFWSAWNRSAAIVETKALPAVPGRQDGSDILITGSTAEPPSGKPEVPAKVTPEVAGEKVSLETVPSSPSEKALLEKLGARRQELEERQRELDMRENLLRSADRKLEGRIKELRDIEQKSQPKGKEAETASLTNLVTMYEAMKPREAARVFDKLDMKVLVPVVGAMNPRKMSEILAAMSPDTASRLTTELAIKSRRSAAPAANTLPAGELQAIETRP